MKLSWQSFKPLILASSVTFVTAILLVEPSSAHSLKGPKHAVNLSEAGDGKAAFVNVLRSRLSNSIGQFGRTHDTFFGLSATDLSTQKEEPNLATLLGLVEDRPQRVEPKYGKPLEGTHPLYPYENIVLQGGGAKGIVYGGAVEALDELGILPYVKRVAAASAGCAPGLMVALGLDAAQLQKETYALEMEEFFDGAKNVPFGKTLFLGWRAWNRLGMHPAERVFTYFGDMLEKYTGNPDLTFLELYQLSGREMCIAVSNVSRGQSEFCHVNTTPDMPIRRAIRASMSLPISWEPIELFEGEKYVDGGLYANFPLKAFDGWFLSTRKGENVMSRMLEEHPTLLEDDQEPHIFIKSFQEAMYKSFQEPNPKTIGFRASDDDSPDQAAYTSYLEDLQNRLRDSDMENTKRDPASEVKFPETKLAQAYLKKKSKETEIIENSLEYELAYVDLTKWFVVNANEIPGSPEHPHAVDTVKWGELLERTPPPFSYTVFGLKSWKEFAEACDFGDKGYVARSDLCMFWDKYSVRHPYMKNRKPKFLDSIGSLAGEVLGSMYQIAEENLLRDPANAKRICMLSTKYVGLMDLDLTDQDKAFLFEIGKVQTLEWIQRKSRGK